MTETEIETYEIEMYRCVKEIRTGVLHRVKAWGKAGMLDRLTALSDGCRITNQSVPASEKGRDEQSDRISGERDHVTLVHGCFPASHLIDDLLCLVYPNGLRRIQNSK